MQIYRNEDPRNDQQNKNEKLAKFVPTHISICKRVHEHDKGAQCHASRSVTNERQSILKSETSLDRLSRKPFCFSAPLTRAFLGDLGEALDCGEYSVKTFAFDLFECREMSRRWAGPTFPLMEETSLAESGRERVLDRGVLTLMLEAEV